MEEDIEMVWNFILDYDSTRGWKNRVIEILTECVVMDGASTITIMPIRRHESDEKGSKIQIHYQGNDDIRFARTRYLVDFFDTISRPITLTSEQVLNLVTLHGL